MYKFELNDAKAGGALRKIAYIDLMAIADLSKPARKPLNNGVLTFPFFTIENVDALDVRHIIVGNDNNVSFSSSHEPNKADDNELILLEVADFLNANQGELGASAQGAVVSLTRLRLSPAPAARLPIQ